MLFGPGRKTRTRIPGLGIVRSDTFEALLTYMEIEGGVFYGPPPYRNWGFFWNDVAETLLDKAKFHYTQNTKHGIKSILPEEVICGQPTNANRTS